MIGTPKEHSMRPRTRTSILTALLLMAAGCATKPVPYGKEALIFAPAYAPRSFAVAPALNLSGQRGPDPLLQADLVYQELQQVRGITVVPVNRVVQAYAGLRLRQVESPADAHAVCEALGVDALVVPTITAYDPYDPPKMGASVQLFVSQSRDRQGQLDLRQLSRASVEPRMESLPKNADFIQASKMFDASAGTTRARVTNYAAGRIDPAGPLGEKAYYLSMDKYAAFVWHELIEETLQHFSD
jgi:hypothetical protein